MQFAILFVTHDIDQALNWADCIYFLYKGQLVNKLDNKELSGLSREQFLQWYQKNITTIDGLSD
jgi:ABC-type dipeptide/oligopeptide/nickel transport system ATPase component